MLYNLARKNINLLFWSLWSIRERCGSRLQSSWDHESSMARGTAQMSPGSRGLRFCRWTNARSLESTSAEALEASRFVSTRIYWQEWWFVYSLLCGFVDAASQKLSVKENNLETKNMPERFTAIRVFVSLLIKKKGRHLRFRRWAEQDFTAIGTEQQTREQSNPIWSELLTHDRSASKTTPAQLLD